MPQLQQALIGVGIMVFDTEGKVLLGKRQKQNEATTWCFPGGKIDENESFEQAAIRELFEETHLNVDVEQVTAFLLMNDMQREYINVTVGLYAHLKSESLKQQIQVTEPHIFQIWQWFSLDDLPENLFPETREMLAYWLKRPISTEFAIYPIEK